MKKIDRIVKYLKNQGIGITTFERQSKLSNGYIKNTIKRKQDITLKILEKIEKNLPDVYYKIFPEEVKKDRPDENHSAVEKVSIVNDCDKIKAENEILKAKLEANETVIKSMQKVIDLQEKLLQQTGVNKDVDHDRAEHKHSA